MHVAQINAIQVTRHDRHYYGRRSNINPARVPVATAVTRLDPRPGGSVIITIVVRARFNHFAGKKRKIRSGPGGPRLSATDRIITV